MGSDAPAGVDSGALVVLGPAVDGVAAVAALGLLPENENRFEPSFFLKTVFALDNSLLTPDFSSGAVVAGVLMIAIVELNKECCVDDQKSQYR